MDKYKFVKGIKYILIRFNPTLVLWYFNFKWRFNNVITILPHHGLGDLAVIVPALKRLALKFDKVNILCNPDYFETIKRLFKLPENVYNLNYKDQDRKVYTVSDELKQALKSNGKIIKLGFYENDPIVNYPNSFFLKLGISTKYVTEKYDISWAEFIDDNLSNFLQTVGSDYIYLNLTTSEKVTPFKKIHKSNKPYVSYGGSASLLGVNDFYNADNIKALSTSQSIINNVIIALKAGEVVISDAGIFNLLIRFKACPPLTVVTRKHSHSHNNLLYKIKFNGTIQSCSFN